ncbi:hypothetical protein PHLGIDRAFT_450503 [Phlebiopsis gigantea 11061_1 CR5-6]|uniref:Enoyl reductase (ER) domain-containing protein n=1 Tax=Phlebiopsis gigantea (strain 11061_1 CR5-6) TaxID=745531 RepID=A0A0C3NNJ5_PHLG1|nr:hypothetical protein PHLGIDRAFT_450503 [Phlebiopsis gigantea 11061_1 CR5-6]
MSQIKNTQVLFMENPQGYPEPNKSIVHDNSHTIDPDTIPLDGGFLLKTLVVSIDPYIRTLMRFVYKRGEVIFNYGVAVVIRTEHSGVKVGDHVYGLLPFQKYSIIPHVSQIGSFRILKNEEKLPWSAYVGMVGMPGQTAYSGWREYANLQKGDVVYVSSAAGPIGSFVVHLAKEAGCKVIASAGSEAKLKFLRDIGVDVVFNYKTEDMTEVLKKEGPINLYWDNVGGETLDKAFACAAQGATFILCGMISTWNEAPPVMNNMGYIALNQLNVHGFTITYLLPKYEKEFYDVVPNWIASGKIKCLEEKRNGLEHASQAVYDVQVGNHTGKCVLVVSEGP